MCDYDTVTLVIGNSPLSNVSAIFSKDPCFLRPLKISYKPAVIAETYTIRLLESEITALLPHRVFFSFVAFLVSERLYYINNSNHF